MSSCLGYGRAPAERKEEADSGGRLQHPASRKKKKSTQWYVTVSDELEDCSYRHTFNVAAGQQPAGVGGGRMERVGEKVRWLKNDDFVSVKKRAAMFEEQAITTTCTTPSSGSEDDELVMKNEELTPLQAEDVEFLPAATTTCLQQQTTCSLTKKSAGAAVRWLSNGDFITMAPAAAATGPCCSTTDSSLQLTKNTTETFFQQHAGGGSCPHLCSSSRPPTCTGDNSADEVRLVQKQTSYGGGGGNESGYDTCRTEKDWALDFIDDLAARTTAADQGALQQELDPESSRTVEGEVTGHCPADVHRLQPLRGRRRQVDEGTSCSRHDDEEEEEADCSSRGDREARGVMGGQAAKPAGNATLQSLQLKKQEERPAEKEDGTGLVQQQQHVGDTTTTTTSTTAEEKRELLDTANVQSFSTPGEAISWLKSQLETMREQDCHLHQQLVGLQETVRLLRAWWQRGRCYSTTMALPPRPHHDTTCSTAAAGMGVAPTSAAVRRRQSDSCTVLPASARDYRWQLQGLDSARHSVSDVEDEDEEEDDCLMDDPCQITHEELLVRSRLWKTSHLTAMLPPPPKLYSG